MSPQDEGLDTTAAKMATQLQLGKSTTRIYLEYRDRYPLTDPAFLDQALAMAEEFQATAQRLRDLGPNEEILEAYERPLALDRPVGVRYAVQLTLGTGEKVWRTYGVDVLPGTTRAELEAQILEKAAANLLTKPTAIDFQASIGLEPRLEPINALFGPLPARI